MDAGELRDACRDAARRQEATKAALAAHLDDEGRRLLEAYEAAFWRRWQVDGWVVEFELARHLPGLAPTIRVLLDHIKEQTYDLIGRCCRGD